MSSSSDECSDPEERAYYERQRKIRKIARKIEKRVCAWPSKGNDSAEAFMAICQDGSGYRGELGFSFWDTFSSHQVKDVPPSELLKIIEWHKTDPIKRKYMDDLGVDDIISHLTHGAAYMTAEQLEAVKPHLKADQAYYAMIEHDTLPLPNNLTWDFIAEYKELVAKYS